MIGLVAILKAKAGKETALAAVLEGLVAPTKAEIGAVFYSILRRSNAEGEYVVTELYRDKDAFATHMASSHVAAALNRFGELLNNDPELRTVDWIDGFGRFESS